MRLTSALGARFVGIKAQVSPRRMPTGAMRPNRSHISKEATHVNPNALRSHAEKQQPQRHPTAALAAEHSKEGDKSVHPHPPEEHNANILSALHQIKAGLAQTASL
jgi:hypothetical protein